MGQRGVLGKRTSKEKAIKNVNVTRYARSINMLQTPRLWEVLHTGAGGALDSSAASGGGDSGKLLAPGECVTAH